MSENEKAVRDPITEALIEAKAELEFHGVGNCRAVWLIDAALQSQSNTDGWVMVPVEPTSDQVNDGADAMRQAMAMFNRGRSVQTAARRVYEAMLSAAPKAPQQVSNTPQDDLIALHGDGVLDSVSEEFRMQCVQQEQSGEVVDAYNLHCKTCNGHGFVTYSVRHGESDFEDFEQECPVCDGAGKAPKHVQDLQARYQEARSELHALNMKIGMESLLSTSSATPTATTSQESAPEQVTPDGYVSHDAYRGAMERAYLAEKRLHAAEEKLRKESEINTRLCRELNNMNGPTFMGEPVLSAPGQEVVAVSTQEPDLIRKLRGLAAMIESQEGWRPTVVDEAIAALSAPPTSTAIAAMVIKQAADIVVDRAHTPYAKNWDEVAETIRNLLPANAEAELEALMMKVADIVCDHCYEEFIENNKPVDIDDLLAIVRRVLDEKGE